MSYLSRHSLYFCMAALAGGGLAFILGRNDDRPAGVTSDTVQGKSKFVLPGDGEKSQGQNEPGSPSWQAATLVSGSSRAKTSGIVSSASIASAPTSADQGQNGTMLKLLQALRSPPSVETSSFGEKSRQDLKAALEGLLKHLRQSELARAVMARRDTEGYISTFVKISPPSAVEINTLKQILLELHAGLSPEQLLQFQNESLWLLRQFVFPQDKSLVVFLTEHFDQRPLKAGQFHSHLTRKPDLFWHHHNGEPIGTPPGETTYEGGIITNPVSPAFRYYHLTHNQ